MHVDRKFRPARHVAGLSRDQLLPLSAFQKSFVGKRKDFHPSPQIPGSSELRTVNEVED